MFRLSNATFRLKRPYLISNEISTYIKDTTNKSLEKYKNKVRFIIPNTTTDLTNDSYPNIGPNKGYPSNFFALLPFVSLMSFLAGYKLFRLMN
jgi:hypothetical protein